MDNERKKLLNWLVFDVDEDDPSDKELASALFLSDPEIMNSQDTNEIMKLLDIKQNGLGRPIGADFTKKLGGDNG
tara:strand:+ start:666 stop:890 length:225 start_codon:yes stop_codon:yes gene_type:complete